MKLLREQAKLVNYPWQDGFYLLLYKSNSDQDQFQTTINIITVNNGELKLRHQMGVQCGGNSGRDWEVKSSYTDTILGREDINIILDIWELTTAEALLHISEGII